MIVLLFLLLILLYITYYTPEHFNTFVGKQAIDDQYFYDKLFDDVKYYTSSPEMSGCYQCYKEKPASGYCVEYGLTDTCYLFPY